MSEVVIYRPMIFTGESVRAILAGRKTQTRRLVDMRVPMDYIGPRGEGDDPTNWGYEADDGMWYVLGRGHADRFDHGYISIRAPHGEPGGRLWVRETHTFCPKTPSMKRWSHTPEEARVLYAADGDIKLSGPYGMWSPKWRPSIHMPRWASRIDLEIVNVRVERLHEITEEDARAEGFTADDISKVGVPARSARQKFCELWDAINGKRATWVSNPFVWAYEFKRVQP